MSDPKPTALELVDSIESEIRSHSYISMVSHIFLKKLHVLRASILSLSEQIREETRKEFQTLLDQKGADLAKAEARILELEKIVREKTTK